MINTIYYTSALAGIDKHHRFNDTFRCFITPNVDGTFTATEQKCTDEGWQETPHYKNIFQTMAAAARYNQAHIIGSIVIRDPTLPAKTIDEPKGKWVSDEKGHKIFHSSKRGILESIDEMLESLKRKEDNNRKTNITSHENA